MSSMFMAKIEKNSTYGKILHGVKSSTLVADGDNFHFLVSACKGENYLNFCNEVVMPFDPASSIRKYTEHKSDLYGQVNLSLASDSPALSAHGEYIKQLRASVISQPLHEDCTFYRGCDLSQQEIDQMESLKQFFIPSFTSTSIDRSKAYAKNSLFVITAPYLTKYACSITENLSNYHATEKEVLFACYSAFQLTRVEKVNSQSIISMFLNDLASSSDRT